MRNNPKAHFNVETLAKELDVDIRDVQALVDMGYLDRDLDRSLLTSEDQDRQKLAREFEKSLGDMKAANADRASKSSVTYGQELYKNRRR